ncbi:hypothetical protein [Modestobacter versicolor]|uniref:Fibronectin type-III domain-containing protein n=1 Tax=Modestobacter versicolor TaxID=429133 RepID=A0A323V7T2_9ACTN|nr:hypothetical protein [Modestobacter versicolor]MBB3676166.1 hypothetical protein [Modestobacter versicolor]PZA19376.1 hypothetical protein DMO24_21065 [Modestobacter versicolor]
MGALRRGLLLVAVTAATVVGLTAAPAQAGFDDRATMTASVGTAKVAPPTSLSTAGTKCVTRTDAWGRTYTTLEARLSWTGSTTPKVTSYQVIAYASGWSYEVTTVNAPTTVVTGSYDSYYATQNVQVVVTARTSYGWTAESAKSGVIKC